LYEQADLTKLKREVKQAASSTEDEAMRVELLSRAELGEV
jgi:hypothetical protein